MKKQRFRDLKQGKINAGNEASKQNQRRYATPTEKIKAFLTDAFMLVMPILYVVIYLIMDGREDFAQHRLFGWLIFLIPLVLIQTAFMTFSGQTPGYRAYEVILVDEKSQQKPSLGIVLFRNLCALLSMFTFFGWMMMFFRKDHKTLHDLLSSTAVVKQYESRA